MTDAADDAKAQFAALLEGPGGYAQVMTAYGYVSKLGADICTRMAAKAARLDMLAPIIDGCGADAHQSREHWSDRSHEKIRLNLIDEVLDRQLFMSDAEHRAAERERVLETLEFLLERGVATNLNADPFENAVRTAWSLAHPDAARDPAHGGHDSVLSMVGEGAAREAFTEPYALIGKYQPSAVKDLEDAIEREGERLRTQFAAARDNAPARLDRNTGERMWNRITKALGWDATPS